MESRINKSAVRTRSFGCWEGNVGSENQVLDMNVGMYDGFLMDNVWNAIPCSDLLALADAAIPTKSSGGGYGGRNGGYNEVNLPESQQYEQPDRTKYLFDLNSPPIVTEPQLITNISYELTPVTPKQIRKQDEERLNLEQPELIIEQSQDPVWELDVNEDFDEDSSDDLNIKKTPQPKQRRRKHRPKVVIEGQSKSAKKPDGSSTGKRKYVRKIALDKSTTARQARRRIDFEEEGILESQSLSPITPDKSEINQAKQTCTRAKRKINFSREAHDSLGNEDASLESYLSMITSSKNGLHFPTIFKKKRTEKCHSSVTSRIISTAFRHMLGFGHFEGFRKKRTKILKRVCDLASFTGMIDGKKWPNYSRKRLTCMEALADFNVNIETKKRTKRNTIVPSSYHNHWFLKNYMGSFNVGFRWRRTYDVDALVTQFENLGIENRNRNRHELVPYSTRYQEKNKNVLVLYQQDRSIVPFEDSNNAERRRKPRPKVDLDDETSRVWHLLLEDINSQGIDGTDEDKTKWWEEERNVFRGRAVSFITRMHLIQGDRRFSQWKGSVVDSVTGVFLTQNVSDHLSSSAFMSLAARYPFKSNIRNEAHEEDKPSQLVIEETIRWHDENSMQNSYEEKEVVNSNELFKFGFESAGSKDRSISQILSSFTEENRGIDDLISSQNSNESISDNHTTSGALEAEYFELRKCASEQSGIFSNTLQSEEQDIFDPQSISEIPKIVENSRAIDKVSTEVKKGKSGKAKKYKPDWDSLRVSAQIKRKRERTPSTMDSVDYETVRRADVNEIADVIKDRGMNNMLAERIKEFLNRLVRDHGSIDLEWLRDVPPDKAKEYLLSFRGLGLKSVECVRLLTLHHLAFPVDTNVGRIAVRLGWVPLQPLPESLQLHLLELYPVLESIQKYLWPRLCKLDQRTLYELHYQMITFGKVFCTKNKPNCNACPMRGECRHFASAFASARLALPAPEDKSIVATTLNKTPSGIINLHHLTLPPANQDQQQLSGVQNHSPVVQEPATPEPIIEVPATPEAEKTQPECDIEDFYEDHEEIPTIRLNMEAFTQNLQTYMENNTELAEGDMSRALVALTSDAAAIPTPKLKNVSQLRTEHQVYELPDSHPLLEGLDKREPDDPCSYLLAIWTPGETAESIQPPGGQCSCQESGTLCDKETCFFCNSIREANSQTVRGTLLIPCRTAMRGSFPLNGTYFQVNEVFADHDSSLNPIDVPRSWLWNLPRRTVYFGTSIPTIFKGLTTEGIQYCFWRGFVCVRGFDQKTRAPRPLMARLHFPVSKLKRSQRKTHGN